MADEAAPLARRPDDGDGAKKRAVDVFEADFETLLSQYYQRFFPAKKFFRWLHYGSQRTFENREFCFTLRGDVYVRYRSYASAKELKDELIKMLPHKIDIGAVYAVAPRNHKTVKAAAFVPLERELIFDIDMDAFNDVRTCCRDANVCHKCWKFMNVAIHIIDSALREDFGFRHLMWVYSGRRGVHCWISDERARRLTQEVRTAIVEYLTIVRGGDKESRKVRFSGALHPSIQRAARIVRPYFEQIALDDMDALVNENTLRVFLLAIPDEKLRSTLQSRWQEAPAGSRLATSSRARWDDFCNELRARRGPGKPWIEHLDLELMFTFVYPRLDAGVSTHLNHLLKSPFSVHPKTQRVCVPIDAAKCDEFDPMTVPTIADLLREIAQYDRAAGDRMAVDGEKPVKDWQKTSIAPYIEAFNKYITAMEGEVRLANQRRRQENQLDLTF